MQKVIFYTKEICPLCDDALDLLTIFQSEYDFAIEKRDITTNDQWLDKYELRIPVIAVNEHEIDCERINYESIDQFLRKHVTKN